MTPSVPLQPGTVTLLGGTGVVACSCGHAVPVPNLLHPVTCPRCGREWIVRVAIKRKEECRAGAAPDLLTWADLLRIRSVPISC